jgi:RimJ/RimL family protein N-acetyltransferase
MRAAGNTLGDGVIVLTPFELADAGTIAEWDLDPETQRWFDWPLTPAGEHRAQLASAERTVRAVWALWEAGEQFSFISHDARTGEGLGWVDLQPRGAGRGNVAYGVLPAHRGRAVATRGVRLASRWAFEVLGWFRLEIRVNVENVASRRVALAAGYQLDGVLRGYGLFEKHEPMLGQRFDEALYSRLRTD